MKCRSMNNTIKIPEKDKSTLLKIIDIPNSNKKEGMYTY